MIAYIRQGVTIQSRNTLSQLPNRPSQGKTPLIFVWGICHKNRGMKSLSLNFPSGMSLLQNIREQRGRNARIVKVKSSTSNSKFAVTLII